MPQPQQNIDKATSLLALIASGLQSHAERSAALTLGDRSRYIGLSDIGRALECPRSVLAGKTMSRPQGNLQKILTLQRGHWLEHGIGQALGAHGLHILPQLEISILYNGVPIKAHIDFALVWEKPRPAVRILELKSTERLPENLYASYEAQLYGQAGLLMEKWNDSVFSLKDSTGTVVHDNLTMPELCHAHFGLALPVDPVTVDIEAWVLCVSMSDAKTFGPYLPDAAMLNLCLNTAQSLWANKLGIENEEMSLDDAHYAKGFHPLCTYCDWNADCPKFHDGEYQPEWSADLERLAQLKNSRAGLEAEIEDLERGLKDACNLSGTTGWVNADAYRFRVSLQPGRRTLDQERLCQELSACLGEDKAAILISRCEREGTPFQKLTVSKINKKCPDQ